MAQRGNGRMDEQKITPFYRTPSPIGATALLPPKKTKESRAGQAEPLKEIEIDTNK